MANPYINIYKDNPTEGDTDGTLVSTGDFSSPVDITLDAAQNETKTLKLAVRCSAGYHTADNTVIQDFNDTNDRWKFSLSENGAYDDAITITGTVDSLNTVFWARASSDSLESPVRDNSVSFKVTTKISNAS